MIDHLIEKVHVGAPWWSVDAEAKGFNIRLSFYREVTYLDTTKSMFTQHQKPVDADQIINALASVLGDDWFLNEQKSDSVECYVHDLVWLPVGLVAYSELLRYLKEVEIKDPTITDHYSWAI